jgi:hypothetical protein
MLRRRVIVTGILAVLAALVAWPFLARYRIKNAVARYARELAAQGEKLTVVGLAPDLPPSEQNAAPALLAAVAQLPPWNLTNQPPMMYRVTPGHALVAWSEDPLPNVETTNVWPGLRAEIERHRLTLGQIRAALSKPALVVNLDYSQGYNLLLPHLGGFREAALWLTHSAMLDLHERRPEDAVTNLQAAVRLVARFKDEPVLVSVVVRFAFSRRAAAATWELLQCPDVNEAQLAALQAEWEAVDFGSPVRAAIRMERAVFLDTLAEMRSSVQSAVRFATRLQPRGNAFEELKDLAQTAIQDPGEGLRDALRYPAYWAWRWYWSYVDELAMMQGSQAAVAAVREAERDGNFQQALASLDAATAQIRRRHPTAGRWFTFNPMNENRSIVLQLRTAEIQRSLVVSAIALKRYQRRHGRLPETLEALVPEFCATVPRDPVNGQPLRYRRLPEGGFLLYSVGENGADDGGDPEPPENVQSRSWLRGRDIVWPKPATALEARLYGLEVELQRDPGRSGARRVVATNGLPETVLRELERLARIHPLSLSNAPADLP